MIDAAKYHKNIEEINLQFQIYFSLPHLFNYRIYSMNFMAIDFHPTNSEDKKINHEIGSGRFLSTIKSPLVNQK